MGTIDFAPLWITLKTGIVASVFSFFIGIAFAELVINTKGRVRDRKSTRLNSSHNA